MNYGIQFRVWGEFALFTRPEMKAERVSYEVPPASALRGVAEAVHWKPAIRYEVRRVAVLNPVRFASIRRNELERAGKTDAIETARQQRASLILRDVDYIVHAEIHLTGADDRDAAAGGNIVSKHRAMFNRRLEAGQMCFQPYLGCREFPAHCAPAEDGWQPCECNGECVRASGGVSALPESPPTMCRRNMEIRPLGMMLREKRYEKKRDKKGREKTDGEHNVSPEFFFAVMENGVVDFRRNGGAK